MTSDQADAIIVLLAEIRDALTPPVEEPSDECQHPEESRVSLGYTNGQPHWKCRDCKHEHVAS